MGTKPPALLSAENAKQELMAQKHTGKPGGYMMTPATWNDFVLAGRQLAEAAAQRDQKKAVAENKSKERIAESAKLRPLDSQVNFVSRCSLAQLTQVIRCI